MTCLFDTGTRAQVSCHRPGQQTHFVYLSLISRIRFVRCPRCGGEECVELALGLFECRSAVVVREDVFQPDSQTVVNRRYGTCLYRWQEAPVGVTPPLCSCGCGLYAVGACARCGVPLAGVHLAKTLPLYCSDCRAVVEEDARLQAEAKAALEAARQAEDDQLTDDRLRVIEDRFERLLRAIRGYEIDPHLAVKVRPSLLDLCPGISPRVVWKATPNKHGVLESTPRTIELFEDEDELQSFAGWLRERLLAMEVQPNTSLSDWWTERGLFKPRGVSDRVPAWGFLRAAARGGLNEAEYNPFYVLSEQTKAHGNCDGGLSATGAYFIADFLGMAAPDDPAMPSYSNMPCFVAHQA